jgi:hypothetical protein
MGGPRGRKRKSASNEDETEEVIRSSTTRRKRSLSPEPSSAVRPRRTGSKKPLCSGYGMNRRKIYPNHFFCSECDLFDREYPLNKRISRFSQKYACTADHKCWIFPTDVQVSVFAYKRKGKMADIVEEDAPVEASPIENEL